MKKMRKQIMKKMRKQIMKKTRIKHVKYQIHSESHHHNNI